jgi:5-methylcytosine-specific restriction endonuclease McrA
LPPMLRGGGATTLLEFGSWVGPFYWRCSSVDSEQIRRFLDAEGDKPRREKKAVPNRMRRRSPLEESPKHREDRAYWSGVKAGRLYERKQEKKSIICGVCEKPIQRGVPDADHIVPRSQGGKSVPENMQFTHRACHRRKHGDVEWSGGE